MISELASACALTFGTDLSRRLRRRLETLHIQLVVGCLLLGRVGARVPGRDHRELAPVGVEDVQVIRRDPEVRIELVGVVSSALASGGDTPGRSDSSPSFVTAIRR